MIQTPDPTPGTEAAYDATASRYYDRWHHRDVLLGDKKRLARLLPPGGTVLDVGCGTGRDLRWFAQAGFRSMGVDRSAAMSQLAAREASDSRVIRADVRSLPIRDAALDGWWAAASLLHLRRADFPLALAELRRVTRSGGVGYLSVKMGTGERHEPIDDGSHHRYFCYWEAELLDQAIRTCAWEIEKGWTSPDVLGRRPWLSRIVRRPDGEEAS